MSKVPLREPKGFIGVGESMVSYWWIMRVAHSVDVGVGIGVVMGIGGSLGGGSPDGGSPDGGSPDGSSGTSYDGSLDEGSLDEGSRLGV
jgi:hypothetical protein